MTAHIYNWRNSLIAIWLLVWLLSVTVGVKAQNRLAHLSEWEGEYPIDNTAKPPANFFRLPEISLHLTSLLGATESKRLLRAFEKSDRFRIIDGYLVATGSASKSDPDGYTESALIAVLLRDPFEYGMICVGTSKKLGDKLASEAEWNCTRGDWMRGSEEYLPLKIRAEIDPDASRKLYGAADSSSLPPQLIKRYENIEHLATVKVKAEYPEEAQNLQVSGRVRVLLEVSESGDVLKAEIISGHDMLREAVLKAARQCKFKPSVKDGKPVKKQGVLDFYFTVVD
jgi:TonB family protein